MVATSRSTTITIIIRITISTVTSAATDRAIGNIIRNTAEMLRMGTDKLRINSGVKVPVGRAVLVIAPAVEQETVRVAAELGIAPAVAALAIALVVVEPGIGPAVAALAIALVVAEP